MRVFFNKIQLDLFDKQSLGYTKQVNSLKDLASRQSNFSPSFKIPKTANNVRAMGGLGMTGSNSMVPYVKNEARLFVGNNCLVFSGWGVPVETTEKHYEVSIYDGNIDFFKALDSVKFNDIPLPELEHTKDTAEVVSNWENGNIYYAYLAADYNGLTHFISGGNNYLNIDYLIPSVPIAFLWERIFEHFGFTYSGSVFQEPEFNDTFLTYPKGQIAGEINEIAFSGSWVDQKVWVYSPNTPQILFDDVTFSYNPQLNSGEIIQHQNTRMKSFQISETGRYKITATGSLDNKSKKGVTIYLALGKNIGNQKPGDINTGGLQKIVEVGSGTQEFDKTFTEDLAPGENLTVVYYTSNRVDYDYSTVNLELSISKINKESVDQVKFFKGLTPKDFYKEVMWRFGLTPFPSKDENHIEFLTWEERINGPTVDWSDKFIRQLDEGYSYESYAQSNYYRFKYNGEGDDFNDGLLTIDNRHLKDVDTMMQSKTYSVEETPVDYPIGGNPFLVPKMQLWEKELKEEGENVRIEYKARDARFSFIRGQEIAQSTPLGSQQLGELENVSKVRVAQNWNYSNQEVIERRYTPVRSLFRNNKIHKIELFMSEAEFNEFDLKPTVFIKQMGGEFLVDSLKKKDLKSKLTEAELIKINR